MPTYRSWKRMGPIIERCSAEELDAFQHLNHTIGGMMVFPGQRRPGVQTLNGARGWTAAVGDRLDLTVECIRRFYSGEPSPLERVLLAYRDFFDLFESFEQYVDFFLLQNMVDADGRIHFLRDFHDFEDSPLPRDLDDYLEYRARSMAFIEARNRRIEEWAQAHLAP